MTTRLGSSCQSMVTEGVKKLKREIALVAMA
jgi:hypothetical protein